jgi:hypothetical protein
MNVNRNINRRQALQNLGLVGAGAALAACGMPVVAETPDIDVAILNFALNLEYLEAEFYLQAAFGRSLSAADSGGGPAPIGGRKVTFTSDAVRQYAEEIAIDEENHVKFLRSALGASAVARPQLDIGPAFAAAANAAFGTTLTPAFDPYANDLFFLHGAFVFEDVGVTAYKGAARLITNKDYLEAAAGILAVEAYHAGEIRTQLYAQKDVVVAAYGVTVETIVKKISDLRAAAGGGKDQGINDGGKGNIVVTDANSIAFSRSTDEVLKIVTLGGVGNKGGFFPNGLNGTIK